eukprot:jgi/Galph1/4809/GphlegSOOS_G3497.1
MNPSQPCTQPTPFIQRYFELFYYPYRRSNANEVDLCEDVMIAKHSNHVFVVFLSSKHALFQQQQTVVGVEPVKWGSQQKVRGKWKKGGRSVQPRTAICRLATQSGKEYVVPAGVYGTLVEVNQRLIKEPNILLDKPTTEGYIAIILPRRGSQNSQQLLNSELYFESCEG